MSRALRALTFFALTATVLAGPARGQSGPAQPPRPAFETTKVEGTDNVYIFRSQNHQAMFVVTREGVIATDPLGYGRPQAAIAYLEAIRKRSRSGWCWRWTGSA
ncbi:MAG: hypothetical protein ACYDA8_02330 [Deferrisomatales bacterium]